MKKLILLGSTGSIGCQCLDVVRCHPGRFEIAALAAHRNQEMLAQQCREFSPRFVALTDEKAAALFPRNELAPGAEFLSGPDSLVELVRRCDADTAVIATVGAVGFQSTFEAVRTGKHIALANKEVLAMAGDLLMREARQCGVPIVPIDSEHSAILQCLQSGRPEEVERIILTASGGPFRGRRPEDFENVPVEEALNHPTWNMGAKITIDSATLFNKGLELIEAHHLFQTPLDRIDVVVHPQSIIHSMIEFCDGSIMAQLGDADMRTPIQYALSYPERIERSGRKLNLLDISQLTFFPPDLDSFPCLSLAYEAAQTGGTMPAYLSVANEEVVSAYLNGRICFGAIPRILEQSMKRHSPRLDYTLEDIQAVDRESREITQEILASL
ncbi:MAG: 1-deoxy-D-xylulose-5-phosphate reductoisomerase [Candidatus Omnitrophica bacterium]|nr:1-deoxy-D-xylulose-5-phosphate reductoisomerase [Candidatus Omnitrophota bacterium]